MTVTHALGETADGGSGVPVTDAAREALVRARDHLLKGAGISAGAVKCDRSYA